MCSFRQSFQFLYVLLFFCIYNQTSIAELSTNGSCLLNLSQTLTKIDLRYCELKAFDFTLPSVTYIVLTSNDLAEIPSVLATYPRLESLSVSYNSITSYPESLVLPKLTQLSLLGNPLKSFTASGENLPALTFLNLGGTQINEMPLHIGTFTKLRRLYMHSAGLSDFDVVLPNSLRKLDLSNNSLTIIPRSIYELDDLTELIFNDNPLEPIVLRQNELDFLQDLDMLQLTYPSNTLNCTKPNKVDYILAQNNEGNNERLAVCVTESPAPTSTPDSTRTTEIVTNTDFPMLYILIWAISIGLLILVFICWLFIKRKQKNVRTNHIAPLENQLQSNAPYARFRSTMMDAISANEAVMIVPDRSSHSQTAETSSAQYSNPSSIGTESAQYGVSILYNNLQVYRIDLKDISDVKCIGVGAFAIVWLVKYGKDKFLASKRLRTDDLSVLSLEQMEAFTQEIRIVSMFKHTNIVEFVGVAWDGANQKVCLQMLFEYMEGGDLKQCLTKSRDISDKGVYLPRYWNSNKIAIARDIAAALVYLHSFRPPILHRDLKAKNILLTSDYSTAKLSDFGVARIRSQNTTTMTGGVGTGRWLAPEIANCYTKYNESCDIYSFGIVLMELETHDTPFINVKNDANESLEDFAVLYNIFHGELSPMIGFSQDREKEGHEGIYALAERCLSKNSKLRPTALSIVQELDILLQEEHNKLHMSNRSSNT